MKRLRFEEWRRLGGAAQNSKVNHKDYVFDHITWGVDVVSRVNSPRVKILFDIYHAQIMDGDIVRNIRDFRWIGHFNTGGNPGRHDIDDSQELNYRYIAQAIVVDLGYTGYLYHEYSPTEGHDPIETLNRAIEICDV